MLTLACSALSQRLLTVERFPHSVPYRTPNTHCIELSSVLPAGELGQDLDPGRVGQDHVGG
ncbi:MAG: hypothetical protein ACRDOB_25210, partial [Streptosporangiaceae bacterium]